MNTLARTLLMICLAAVALPSPVEAADPIRIGVVDVERAVKSTSRMQWILKRVDLLRHDVTEGEGRSGPEKARLFHRGELEKLRKIVAEVCTKLARSHGLDLLLTTGARSGILYAAPALDLTKELTAALDAAMSNQGGASPVPDTEPAPRPARSGLPVDIEFDDEDKHVAVGARTIFVGTLRNDGKTVLRDVRVSLRLPKGMKFGGARFAGKIKRAGENMGKGVVIPELKPGQEVHFEAMVHCTRAGRHLTELSVTAEGFPKPVLDHESTHVR